MGRSSNSSDYQLSANRLISRVHVKAQYIAASTPLHVSKVVITCSGWNGVKVHCYGRTWDLGKGDSFTSETESAEIMLDVQDARVIVGWPEVEKSSASSSEEPESSWEDDGSPSRRVKALSARGKEIHSSPERPGHRLASPESPSLAKTLSVQKGKFSDLFADFDGETSLEIPEVKVFEDAFADATPENNDGDEEEATQLPASFEDSFSSSLSEPSDSSDDHNPDEENDPLIHSFGPFGANILPNLESFTTAATPEQPRRSSTSKSSQVSPAKDVKPDTVPMVNHVVNQLAFSRLSSTPLASVMHQLPSKYLSINPISNLPDFTITKAELHVLLLKVACVGEIRREGKDAAGQPLESEFYYIPDMDDDEERKAAVVDGLRKPSLRNCRKQHKVCISLLLLSEVLFVHIVLLDLHVFSSNIIGRNHELLRSLLRASLRSSRIQGGAELVSPGIAKHSILSTYRPVSEHNELESPNLFCHVRNNHNDCRQDVWSTVFSLCAFPVTCRYFDNDWWKINTP